MRHFLKKIDHIWSMTLKERKEKFYFEEWQQKLFETVIQPHITLSYVQYSLNQSSEIKGLFKGLGHRMF